MKYIILDLEASCWKNQENRKNEIIEIGSVCIDDEKTTLGEFDVFVKPILNPNLSEFCIELTSINQSMVDNANTFPVALKEFKDWIDSFGDKYILCSWGYYDRVQFEKDCKLHGLETKWTEQHISLKHQYAKINGMKKPPGLKRALNRENIELTGTHHRGFDDAKNISKIFIKYFDEWDFDISL